jgi:hypothetical protein
MAITFWQYPENIAAQESDFSAMIRAHAFLRQEGLLNQTGAAYR